MGGKGGGGTRKTLWHRRSVFSCSIGVVVVCDGARERERKCGEWEVGKWEMGGKGKGGEGPSASLLIVVVAFEKGDREKRRRFRRSEKVQGKRRENALRGCFLFARKHYFRTIARTFSQKYCAFNSV